MSEATYLAEMRQNPGAQRRERRLLPQTLAADPIIAPSRAGSSRHPLVRLPALPNASWPEGMLLPLAVR